MTRTLEVLFAPAEFAALGARDLSRTTCVVFDVLRFTSTVVTALGNGAAAVIPVTEISEALAWKQRQPDVLLGGERGGLRIGAALTGGIDFDLGNSPREYTAEKVAGRTIVATTTNGARALKACAGARAVFACSFLNLGATARLLAADPPEKLVAVCSGTLEEAAYEDAAAAGALCDALWQVFDGGHVADSAQIARLVYERAQASMDDITQHSRNARRLLSMPELRDDVAFCLRKDIFELVARVDDAGRIVKYP